MQPERFRPPAVLLARSVALNVLGRTASLAIGFGASIALARWLGPSDRGLLGLMTSASSLALAAGGVGIPLAVMYHASRREAQPSALFGNSLAYTAVLAAVLVPLAWVFHGDIADVIGRGHGGETWVLAAALVPITFLDWTTHNQLVGALRFGLYNVLTVLSKLAYLAGVIVLLGVVGLGVAAGLIAAALASAVMVAGSLKPILASGRPRLNRGLFGRMVRYGARVQVGTIFQLANARLDVLILQFFRPLSDVGYYVVAQTIAELVVTLGTAFQTSVLPLVSHYEGDERQDETTAASVRHHGILAGAAVIGNAVFGSAVILFAFGAAFHPAVAPMLVLLPGIWFLGMGTVIQGDLSGRGRPGLSSALAGLAAVVTVVFDFLLIPPLGVMGAACASVIAYTAYGGASLIALHRVSGIPVRRLIVPTRADFASYRNAMRRALSRLRGAFGNAG